MRAPLKLTLFAALLAVVFAVAWQAGGAVDPSPRTSTVHDGEAPR